MNVMDAEENATGRNVTIVYGHQFSLMQPDLFGLKRDHGGDPRCTKPEIMASSAGIRLVFVHAGAENDRERHVAILLTA